jgi:hypothetical protein
MYQHCVLLWLPVNISQEITYRGTSVWVLCFHTEMVLILKYITESFVIKYLCYVGFEVLTAMGMKSTIFWDITPCSPLKVNWPPPAFTPVSCSAYPSTLKMEAYVPPKLRSTFNGLHCVISQKIVLRFFSYHTFIRKLADPANVVLPYKLFLGNFLV